METLGVEVDRRSKSSVGSDGALSQIIKLSEILIGSSRQETIKAVLEKTSDIFPECRICFVGLKDGKLSVEDGVPPDDHGVGEVVTAKMGKFFLKGVIDGGKTIVINNPHSDKRLDYLKTLIEKYQISGIMFSPLRCVGAEGTNFGILVVDALKERIFSPEDKQLIKTISRLASSALCRERREEARLAKAVEMERLATLGKNSLRMAHALRNRLTSIGGFASRSERIIASNKEVFGEVLEEKLKALERYSRIIVDDIEMMEYIVSTVLDISKPAVLNLEKCSVNNLLMKEVEKYRFSYSGVSFRSNLDWRLSGVSLMIDKYGLQICISDLVSNAYEAEATTVTIETKMTKKQCIITVINNGHDIDPRDQEDIFEMFMTKGKPRGTGLGLPTARHIVNGHGGEIKVHSKDGRTMFEITLPRYPVK